MGLIKICTNYIRHSWPEKPGMTINRPNGISEYLFLHFFSIIKIIHEKILPWYYLGRVNDIEIIFYWQIGNRLLWRFYMGKGQGIGGIIFRIWRSKFLFGYKTVGSRIIMKNCLMMPNIGIWEMRITVPYENIADLL